MKLQWYVYFLGGFLSCQMAEAQTLVACQSKDEFAYLCGDVCILCDLDNHEYMLVHRDTVIVDGANIGCGFGVESRYGIVAMSESLTIEVSVGDCTGNFQNEKQYFSFVLYEDLNGSCFDDEYGVDLVSVFECDDEKIDNSVQWIPENSKRTFESIRPLQIGAIYIAGFGTEEDVVCPYSVKIIAGSTKIPELNRPFTLNNIYGPCLGSEVTYAVQDTVPITEYVFTVNGDTVPSVSASFSYTYNRIGTYELCVQGSNYCYESPKNCYTITVNAPSETTVQRYLCQGSCVSLSPDSVACQPGKYEMIFLDQNGCDSLVTYQVLSAPLDTNYIEANLCLGDTLGFVGEKFWTTGQFLVNLTNRFGCDSLIILDVVVSNCPIPGTISHNDVLCHGAGATGGIAFMALGGEPPFQYSYQRLGYGEVGRGIINEIGEVVDIPDLGIGTYVLEMVDQFGNQGFLNTEITQPPPLNNEITVSNFNGFSISCAGASDGRIHMDTKGGTEPYAYAWSNNRANTNTLERLMGGTYTVTTTDSHGCQLIDSIALSAPVPIEIMGEVIDEACGEMGTGRLAGLQIRHGVAPYDQILQNLDSFTVLEPDAALYAGNYLLEVFDGNGCSADFDFTIKRPFNPEIQLEGWMPSIKSGERIALELNPGNGALKTVRWHPGQYYSCDTCLSTYYRPVQSGEGQVTVTSMDGCVADYSFYVEVKKDLGLRVPNAFSPNGDGFNDQLLVYVRPSLNALNRFAIYDRWGNLMHQKWSLEIGNVAISGWDGSVPEGHAPIGAYVWVAEVVYQDGSTGVEQGDLVLIR